MRSLVLMNRGVAGFDMEALPLEAQFSPVYAITSLDINHDGKADLVLAGNNGWNRIRYGRYEANHGTVLLGDGKGHFSFLPPRLSGITVRGDVRSLQQINHSLYFGINDQPVKVFSPR